MFRIKRVRRAVLLILVSCGLCLLAYVSVTSSWSFQQYGGRQWLSPVDYLLVRQALGDASAALIRLPPDDVSTGNKTSSLNSEGSGVDVQTQRIRPIQQAYWTRPNCIDVTSGSKPETYINAADWNNICLPLIRGQKSTTERGPYLPPNITAANYLELASNCSCFRSTLGYMTSPKHSTVEERNFPIAFSILTYENLEQTERLLRLIYKPHNFYCVHVDAKAAAEMHDAVTAIATCLPNVIVAWPPVKVYWGKVSIVEAEVLCIKQLLDYSQTWKYFVNLVGRDFPLKTNSELVKILKTYNGANDIDGSRSYVRHYFPEWFEFSWIEHEVRGNRKEPPPHGFNIAKGSTHMAATRGFVEFAVRDPRAKELLHWMRDIKVPDEHFFQTLNHNPQFKIPGSFNDDPDKKISLARAKHWSFIYPQQACAGEYVRWICNIGIGDLPWLTKAPELFVNKIRLEVEPAAFRCLELWYRHRAGAVSFVTTPNGTLTVDSVLQDQLDLRFYADQLFARKHF